MQREAVKAVVLSEKAKQKKEATYPQEGGFGLFTTPCGSNEQNGIVEDKIDSLGFIAKDAKVGRATVAKVNKILEKAPEKIKQECPCETLKELAEKLQIKYNTAKNQWIPKAKNLSEKTKQLLSTTDSTFSDKHAQYLLKYPHGTQDKLAQTTIDKSLVG